LSKSNQLAKLDQSGKPYIIYKSQTGFDLYTNFSKKIVLNNKNIQSFLKKKNKKKIKVLAIPTTAGSGADDKVCINFAKFVNNLCISSYTIAK